MFFSSDKKEERKVVKEKKEIEGGEYEKKLLEQLFQEEDLIETQANGALNSPLDLHKLALQHKAFLLAMLGTLKF